MPILQGLFIYPLKGTRSLALREGAVERRGLADDRRWMLIDRQGRFLSQRTEPRLAHIQTHVSPEGLAVSAPEMAPLTLPVPDRSAPRARVQIWKDDVEAALVGATADAWFSGFLGSALRLVYMDARAIRPVDAAYAVGEDEVSFADGYPLLLTATASLEALNNRLAAPLPMDRFRPNVVVSGSKAFEEDRWRQVRIGEVLFHVVKPCARCVVTTIDQQTGVQGKEPLRTLASFRRRNGEVYFGQNLIPAQAGILRAGDPVEIVA